MNAHAAVTRNDQPASNGQGGFTPQPRTIYPGLPCRVAPLSASEKLLNQQRGTFASHALYIEPGADIQPQDIATIDCVRYRVQFQDRLSEPWFNKWQLEEIQEAQVRP